MTSEFPTLDPVSLQLPYSVIVHKPDPNVEYYEAYKNIGRKYTLLKAYDLAATVIQQAIDALVNGGKIFIKAGEYILTSTIEIAKPLSFIGESSLHPNNPYGTRFLLSEEDLTGFKIYAPSNNDRWFYGIFKDFTISMASGVTSTSAVGIHLAGYMSDLRFEELSIFYVDKAFKISGGSQWNFWITRCLLEGLKGTNKIAVSVETNFVERIHLFANHIAADVDYAFYSNGLENYRNQMYFMDNTISTNKDAIYLSGNYHRIIGNTIYNIPASYNGVVLDKTKYATVLGNIILSDNQDSAIKEVSPSDYNIIINNQVNGTVLPIVKAGANTIIRHNRGYATENSGIATIPSGQTSVTFTHGLAGTPTIVVLGATHSEVADAYVSAKDATNITITVPNAVSADREISWYAEYKP